MKYESIKYLIILLLSSIIYGQSYIYSDPLNVIYQEQKLLFGKENHRALLIRPLLDAAVYPYWSINFTSQFYFNDNKPNLENMGNRWLGKGAGIFTSVNFSFVLEYFIFSLEPYYYFNQNINVKNQNRVSNNPLAPDLFNKLNDFRYTDRYPYKITGIREAQIYFHYDQIGFGLSNANMWWGPGIHNSLTMTNNTTGFPHLMIGTINEKRVGDLGLNFRYIFSKLEKIVGDPYYTALVGSASLYYDPTITFGFSRNYLSGGVRTDRPFNIWDAALLPFESLFMDTKIKNYPSEWEAHDPWDETMSGFITLDFPKSGLLLFIELGTNDHRQNWSDLRSQPDHSFGGIIGLRKYGLLHNEKYFGGFEYLTLKESYTTKWRIAGNWYNIHDYNYSSYDGRRWAAHSGSDSDDFYLFIGYNDNDWTFIPGFNYERHGIINGNPPEVKIEFRLNIRFFYNDYHINLYYERELINNSEFVPNEVRRSNVFLLGLEKDLSELINSFPK